MTSNIENTLSNIKETTMNTVLLTVIGLIIVLSIIYYIYIKTLQSRECSLVDTMFGTINGKIHSIVSTDPKCGYTLKDYYIKSAYNACSLGNYRNDFVGICVLKDIIKQGARCLDFEIFSVGGEPVVATSTSDSYYLKETYNSIPFAEVMKIITSYAFAGGTCPNSNDPLIIHLRFKTTHQNIYTKIAKIFESYNNLLLGKTYSFENHGKNLGDVKLLDLMGKIIIAVDRDNLSFLENKKFYEYVNITSNSLFMRALRAYDVQYTPDMNELIEFNKKGITLCLPDKGTNPQNPKGISIRETGTQMIAMRYQSVDNNLDESNLFFDEQGYAFVLKPDSLRYIEQTIQAPPPQTPDVSYANREIKGQYYNFQI